MRPLASLFAANAALVTFVVSAEWLPYDSASDITLTYGAEPPVESTDSVQFLRHIVSYYPRFNRISKRNAEGLGRRLTNSTNSTTTTTTNNDPLLGAIIGTLTVMGGTQIQPVILLINGFIAADVGKYWRDFLDDVQPNTIIALFRAVLAGFSVGTVGIQNMPFQTVLQGGVLFASAWHSTVREPAETFIDDNFDGDIRKWLLLGLDSATTGIGSIAATILKALSKVVNSAYLSATMCVRGWITIIEDSMDETFKEKSETIDNSFLKWLVKNLETILIIIVMLFCLWWHSLILAMQRVAAWGVTKGKKPPIQMNGTSPIARIKALGKLLIWPIGQINKVVQSVSVALGTSFNLKGEPQTLNQIVMTTCATLGLPPPQLVIAKFGLKFTSKKLLGMAMKGKDKSPQQVKQTMELTQLICDALDVNTMRKIVFEIREGSGDFAKILDRLFEDVKTAIIKNKRGALGRMTPDQLQDMWMEGKDGIKKQIAAKVRGMVSTAVLQLFRIQDEEEVQYITGVLNTLNLDELASILRLVKTGRFAMQDLQDLATVKAAQLKEKALLKAQRKAQEAAEAAKEQATSVTAKVETAVAGVDKEAGAINRKIEEEGLHESVPVFEVDPSMAQRVLEKSYEQAPGQLADCLLDVVQVRAEIKKIPVIGPLFGGAEATVRNTLTGLLQPIPFAGPKLLQLSSTLLRQIKRKIVSKSMGTFITANDIPLKQVAELVRKFAQQDEYLDELLEQIFCPEAALRAAEQAVQKTAEGDGKGLVEGQKTPAEPSRFAGMVLKTINTFGPGACNDMLIKCLTEYFDVDLEPAKEFVRKLAPADLIAMGQAIIQTGFNFERCTELIKNKVQEHEFQIPLEMLATCFAEDDISFSYASDGIPPTIVDVSEDWIGSVKDITGDAFEPKKGDRLTSIGQTCAVELDKDQFDLAVQAAIEDATKAGEDCVTFVLERGLNIDVAMQFREVLPNVMRRLLGVPFAQGKAFARNLTMEQMKRLVMVFLTGGVKKLDDMATDLQCEVNFEQAFKAHIPLQLKQKFGFSLAGARLFAEHLDEADGMGLGALMVRFQQMVGFGDLEAMFFIISTKNLHLLDQLHKRRYKPRVELTKYVNQEDLDSEKRINVALTASGQFQLQYSGEETSLGNVSMSTLDIVLKIWREKVEEHWEYKFADIPEWSDEEVVTAIYESRTDPATKRIDKETWKWPEDTINLAELGPDDQNVAWKLWFASIEEARADVWSRYHKKLIAEADHCLGGGHSEEASARTDDAEIEFAMKHSLISKEILEWMRNLFARLPNAGPRRTDPLLKIEKAIQERDTFRLSKIAQKHGMNVPFPVSGLMAQFKQDLQSMPFDVTSHANELAEFVSRSQNPLTGHFAGKKQQDPTEQVGGAAAKRDAEAQQKSPPVLAPDADHSAPPPEASTTGRVGAISSTPCKLFGAGAAPGAPGAEPPKLKGLFTLAQRGDFSLLSKFSASKCDGGAREVGKTMRKKCVGMLSKEYGMEEKQVIKVVEILQPSLYVLPKETRLQEGKPSKDEPMPASPDDRDGQDVPKGKRCRVVEEIELKGVKYGRLVRPQRGWLPMSELEMLPTKNCEDQEDRAMERTAQFLRSLKEYDILTLQDISDEIDLDVDFIHVAIDQIVAKATKMTKGVYNEKTILMAANKMCRKDITILEECFRTIAAHDKEYLIELLQLPPPPPPKIKKHGIKHHKKEHAAEVISKLENKLEKLQIKLMKYAHIDLDAGDLDAEWVLASDPATLRGTIKGGTLFWPKGTTSKIENFANQVQMIQNGKMCSAMLTDPITLQWSDGEVWSRRV